MLYKLYRHEFTRGYQNVGGSSCATNCLCLSLSLSDNYSVTDIYRHQSADFTETRRVHHAIESTHILILLSVVNNINIAAAGTREEETIAV
jgi:hypothetical protein